MCARPHQGKFNKHTAPGDTLTDFFSDTGSTPVSSTRTRTRRTPQKAYTYADRRICLRLFSLP
nr:MAG TPA: hypothetical protein [Caudoviricetes sp.]